MPATDGRPVVSEYVKFTYERASAEIAPFDQLAELNECRRKLRKLHLIGVDSKGIGFGNLSIRDGTTNNFYVTGSATGGLGKLALADCVRVVAYDFAKNCVRYEGAAIYEADARASAVIHCHELVLWGSLLDRAPTTSKAVAYGTPEMAYEIIHLFKTSDVQKRKILVMAGHEGGIIAFGKTLEEAFGVLVRARESDVRLPA
jgi:L-ribulose-5-phosphate 4-epimerase